MKILKILPLGIFFIIIFFLFKGLNLHPDIIPSPLINKPAPLFALPTLDNPKKIVTNHDFLHHITLLNVWASWCTTCADEHEFLIKLAKNTDIILYGFNYKDDLTNAKKWLAEYGNPYQIIVVDQQGLSAIDWGVYGTPETFLIDQQGIVRYKVIGSLTQEKWDRELWPLIKKIQKERT